MASRFSFDIGPLQPRERTTQKIARALENFNEIGRYLRERDVRGAIREAGTPTEQLDPNAEFGATMGRAATAAMAGRSAPSTPVGAYNPETGAFNEPTSLPQIIRSSIGAEVPGEAQVSPADPRFRTAGFNPNEPHPLEAVSPLGPAGAGVRRLLPFETPRAQRAEAVVRDYVSRYAPVGDLAGDFLERQEAGRNLSRAISLARGMGADESLVEAIRAGVLDPEDFIEDVMEDEDARVAAQAIADRQAADDARRRALEEEVLEPGRTSRAEAAEAGRMQRHREAEAGRNARAAASRAATGDPRVKERRSAFESQLGPPQTEAEQVALDMLSGGAGIEEIMEEFDSEMAAQGVDPATAQVEYRALLEYLNGLYRRQRTMGSVAPVNPDIEPEEEEEEGL